MAEEAPDSLGGAAEGARWMAERAVRRLAG